MRSSIAKAGVLQVPYALDAALAPAITRRAPEVERSRDGSDGTWAGPKSPVPPPPGERAS